MQNLVSLLFSALSFVENSRETSVYFYVVGGPQSDLFERLSRHRPASTLSLLCPSYTG